MKYLLIAFLLLINCSILFSQSLEELIAVRNQQIKKALLKEIPILVLEKFNNKGEELAQQICVTDAQFTKFVRSEKSEPFLNEIFGIYPARQSDLPNNIVNEGNLFRIEMYNFALNLSTIALVDIRQQKVLSVNYFPQTQPDIPFHLKQLALSIATENTQVQSALGYNPTEKDALMLDTKTALNRSKCERSLHLCVAPTFIKNDKALWAIIDLTDLKLVGIRWTNVGNSQIGG